MNCFSIHLLLPQEQGEKFQEFKKKCTEDLQATKENNVKELAEFKKNAKSKIDDLIQKQSQEEDKFSEGELKEFGQKIKEELVEELKKNGKENDDVAFLPYLLGFDHAFDAFMFRKKRADLLFCSVSFRFVSFSALLISVANPFFLFLKQKEAKKEVIKKVQDAVDKKNQEFDLKQLDEMYAMKYSLLDEVPNGFNTIIYLLLLTLLLQLTSD